MRVFRMILSFLPVAVLVAGCASLPVDDSLTAKERESRRLFQGPVKEVLEHRCIHCHHQYAKNGGLNLQDRDSVFAGDAKGPFLVPGSPEKSRVWRAIFAPAAHPRVMPGDGWGMTQDHRKALLSWIESGAYWPEGKDGKLKIRNYEVEIEDYL